MFVANLTKILNPSQLDGIGSIITRSYAKKTDYIQPIINKTELDNMDAKDPRHFKLIKSPDGYESNAISYNQRMHKFSKILMKNGNSYLARSLIDNALYTVKLKQVEKYNKADPSNQSKIETNPMKIFLSALDNVKPILKITSMSRGGISYQVPVPMSEKEREFKSTKFILTSSNEKDKNFRFYDKLANELIEAHQNKGTSIKKKVDLHKRAEANRAYAHFRWMR